MTNEEAISIMNVIIHMLEPQYDTERVEEAVSMAIKALEQQPCEDCISRTEALKVIEEQKKGFYGVERYAIDECHSAVMKLPSVTPQPKTGHWEYVQYDYNPNIGNWNWNCSECNRIVHGAIKYAYMYCPNCGARMAESEEV